MPGNMVKINNSDELEWYVGDSKMEKLIEFLNEIGFKTFKQCIDDEFIDKHRD